MDGSGVGGDDRTMPALYHDAIQSPCHSDGRFTLDRGRLLDRRFITEGCHEAFALMDEQAVTDEVTNQLANVLAPKPKDAKK
jgi:hypothetical protein